MTSPKLQPPPPRGVSSDMDAMVDLRNTRARLRRIAIAAMIGAIFTYFTMHAIADTGRGPNADPVGGSLLPLLSIFVFVLTTAFAHKFISKKR